MTPCSAYKAGGTRRKGGMFGVMLSSQATITHDGALLFSRWLNTSLPTRSGERIPYFALLVCTAFALPVQLLLS